MDSKLVRRFAPLTFFVVSLFLLGASLMQPGSSLAAKSAGKAKAAKVKEVVLPPHPLEADGKCVSCHQEDINHLMKTPHSDILLLKNKSKGTGLCQSCHGNPEDHLGDSYNPDYPLRFTKNSSATLEEKNAMCSSCHAKNPHLSGWKTGQHENAKVACVDCHNIHQPEKGTKSLKSVQTKVCAGCHANVAHEVKLPSHMPIGEGMECTDCHQVHGTANQAALKDPFPNQTCTSCHMEYRGPFLHSHPPAEESCMNCHTPHGSTAEPLLKAQLPFLCLECHTQLSSNHGLVTRGELDPSGADNTLFTAGKACLNCHTQIHGSNHPGGARFQR